ncbi:hypothetical protein VTK56DRAFT_4182 [Thermocarpiscus australiensis]
MHPSTVVLTFPLPVTLGSPSSPGLCGRHSFQPVPRFRYQRPHLVCRGLLHSPWLQRQQKPSVRYAAEGGIWVSYIRSTQNWASEGYENRAFGNRLKPQDINITEDPEIAQHTAPCTGQSSGVTL